MGATFFDRELKRGSAELLILALLEEQERHGYDLARLIGERSSGVISFHAASLYPTLYRMEDNGLIDGRWVEKAGQRRRRSLQADRRRPQDTDTSTRHVGPVRGGIGERHEIPAGMSVGHIDDLAHAHSRRIRGRRPVD